MVAGYAVPDPRPGAAHSAPWSAPCHRTHGSPVWPCRAGRSSRRPSSGHRIPKRNSTAFARSRRFAVTSRCWVIWSPPEGGTACRIYIAARSFQEWNRAREHSRLRAKRNCGSILNCTPAKLIRKTLHRGQPMTGKRCKAHVPRGTAEPIRLTGSVASFALVAAPGHASFLLDRFVASLSRVQQSPAVRLLLQRRKAVCR
jgi:hypothetical protein